MSSYDHGYPIPKWFLDEVRFALSEAGGWSRPDLLKRANEFRGERENEWDLSAITKFLVGDRQTIEFAAALAQAIGIPIPVVELNNRKEADEVDKVLKRVRPAQTKPAVTKK